MGHEEIKPVILKSDSHTIQEINEYKNKFRYIDIYQSQLSELFEIRNPSLGTSSNYNKLLNAFVHERISDENSGSFVLFPWNNTFLHILDKEELRELRLNRTQELISDSELKIFRNFTAGIAGLSFGNGIALSLVYSGFSDTIKIADSDIFETTNLNRVRFGLSEVGTLKINTTAKEIYDINPYANILPFPDGLNDKNIDTFINGDKKLDVIFDVVDDLSMKVKIRNHAKQAKVPVIMLTSLEDSILVDVERFDLEPDREIFHGLLGDIENDLLSMNMPEDTKAKYAMRIVQPENISYRNLLSLSEVGNKLVSRPHLYSTVSIVCGLASYITKRIALNEDLPSFRKLVKFNEILDLKSSSDDNMSNRDKILKKLIRS